jgi:hypothetical protein
MRDGDASIARLTNLMLEWGMEREEENERERETE